MSENLSENLSSTSYNSLKESQRKLYKLKWKNECRLRINGVTMQGRLYTSKSHKVFVASPDNATCPRVNVTASERVKFRDDYSKGLRMPKNFAKLLFR